MAKAKKHLCLGCNQQKVFRADQKYCSKECVKVAKPTETSVIEGNDWTISIPKTRIHTLQELLEFCEVDQEVWIVDRFICNKWEMGYVDEDGKAQAEQLYQVKAFLKRKVNIVNAKKEIEDLLAAAKLNIPNPKPIKKIQGKKGGMLEINLTDHHFGKLAWKLETLVAHYDLKIAAEVFHKAVDTLLQRSPFETYEEIVFVVGNDLFNNDDTQSRTTAGTQVESDLRHEKTYKIARVAIVETIENKLRLRADKTKIVVCPGNHDQNSVWHLGDSLELYFSKYKDVEVDNSPSSRKYHRYGNVLIGYTHGHLAKKKDLPMLMTVEAKALFCQTKFHEWHISHRHQTEVVESHGTRVRTLPTLCPPDAWHAEMGYVGNVRSSEAFVWDREEGLTYIIVYSTD